MLHHHYSWILLILPHCLHHIVLHLFILLQRELSQKLVIEALYPIDISTSIKGLRTLLLLHHWRKTYFLMVLSPGYHRNKMLMNSYLNFVNVLINIDPLLMNDPRFDLLFNNNQLASSYQECYQITHMEIDPLFTSSVI